MVMFPSLWFGAGGEPFRTLPVYLWKSLLQC
jgi:hypothetical protein